MGSNPQSDPRIFPEIPGFSRSLTHGLTHGVFYRPTLFACGKIPKKPEATGSAGRCDPGVGGSPTHTLSPAPLSHPLCRPEPGLFPLAWFWAHTGLFWAGPGTFPTLGKNPAHRATRGPTGGLDCCRAQKSHCRVLPDSGFGIMIAFAGNFQFLPHPPARTGTWPAGNPPAP